MFFKRWFRGHNPPPEPDKERQSLDQGVSYLYLIMGLQVALVFGVLLAIMFIGKVIATPFWVFVMMFVAGIAGVVYVYRRAKRQWLKFRETIQRVGPSARSLEISVMGGMITMRVENNPRRLLEEGANATPLIEAEPVETSTIR